VTNGEPALRIVGLGELHVRLGSRTAVVGGERTIAHGNYDAFWAEGESQWRWADGERLTESERGDVRSVIARAGPKQHMEVLLDPPGFKSEPRPEQPAWVAESRFEFQPARNRLVYSGPNGIILFVPGTMSIAGDGLAFAADPVERWTGPTGKVLTPAERTEAVRSVSEAAAFKSIALTLSGTSSRDIQQR